MTMKKELEEMGEQVVVNPETPGKKEVSHEKTGQVLFKKTTSSKRGEDGNDLELKDISVDDEYVLLIFSVYFLEYF